MKLCSLILQEHFGETVRIVGKDLFCAISKTIAGICATTKLSRKQVKNILTSFSIKQELTNDFHFRSLQVLLSLSSIDWSSLLLLTQTKTLPNIHCYTIKCYSSCDTRDMFTSFKKSSVTHQHCWLKSY